MVSKQTRLKLARLLKLYKEMITDKGVMVAESDNIEIGTEVFIISEDSGEPQPAVDGDYLSGETIYTVENGMISAIKEKETETPNEETEKPVEEVVVVENEEEQVETPKEDENKVAELESKIAELESTIAELNTKLDEANAKIKEFEEKAKEVEPTPEEMEKEEKFSNELPKGKAKALAMFTKN